MPKRRLPTVCLDEHFKPEVKALFRDAGFRVIRASESRYRARDERDYLREMYSRNEVFVTADEEFVDDLVISGFRRHAGVIFIPKRFPAAERSAFAELCARLVRSHVAHEG